MPCGKVVGGGRVILFSVVPNSMCAFFMPCECSDRSFLPWISSKNINIFGIKSNLSNDILFIFCILCKVKNEVSYNCVMLHQMVYDDDGVIYCEILLQCDRTIEVVYAGMGRQLQCVSRLRVTKGKRPDF